jgi:hypothetical protein
MKIFVYVPINIYLEIFINIYTYIHICTGKHLIFSNEFRAVNNFIFLFPMLDFT